jgi:hypothetical protein
MELEQRRQIKNNPLAIKKIREEIELLKNAYKDKEHKKKDKKKHKHRSRHSSEESASEYKKE